MNTATTFRYSLPYESHFEKLLESSAKVSFNPDDEIDWAAPLDMTKYGMSPEWCSLYGTEMWDDLTEEQRITLSRHEVCSILGLGIWVEGLLQSMILRASYSADYSSPEFHFALTEIADECRHSVMFAKGCQKLGASYRPRKLYHELGRAARILSTPEMSYAAILVGEEALDIMQRDWMRDERVVDEMKIGARIHVTEEARHMKFARIQVRQHLEGKSRVRREATALVTAYAAATFFDAMIHPDVYLSVGLDPEEARRVAYKNPHRREMLKLGNERLMGFLDDVGLITPAARTIYKKIHAL